MLRLAQDEPAQYRKLPATELRAWARAACGAASFATLVNAAAPGRGMTVGEAVDFLLERDLISQRRGLLRREDFADVARALDAALGREGAAYAVNLRSPAEVQAHFARGGGPIMFTGPSTAVWGIEHIYVAVGATPEGLRIVDSARTNYTFLTWAQWQAQTGSPGAGAGAALRTLG